MTRNGKIARLPKDVREELNERLENGEEGKELVKWLNSLAKVQECIRHCFKCKEITEQNLSQWKNGGFRDWQAKEERWHIMHQLREDAVEEALKIKPEETQRHLSQMLTLELARALRDLLEQTTDPKERIQALSQISGRFAQLRREECHAQKTEMAVKKRERELEREEERMWRAELAMLRLSNPRYGDAPEGGDRESAAPKAKRRKTRASGVREQKAGSDPTNSENASPSKGCCVRTAKGQRGKGKSKSGRNNCRSDRIKVDQSEEAKKSTVSSPQSPVAAAAKAEWRGQTKEDGDRQDACPTGESSIQVNPVGSMQIKAEASDGSGGLSVEGGGVVGCVGSPEHRTSNAERRTSNEGLKPVSPYIFEGEDEKEADFSGPV